MRYAAEVLEIICCNCYSAFCGEVRGETEVRLEKQLSIESDRSYISNIDIYEVSVAELFVIHISPMVDCKSVVTTRKDHTVCVIIVGAFLKGNCEFTVKAE